MTTDTRPRRGGATLRNHRRGARTGVVVGFALALVAHAGVTLGALPPHTTVHGDDVLTVEWQDASGGERAPFQRVAWDDLEKPKLPGLHRFRVTVHAASGASALEIPVCAGRKRVLRDGAPLKAVDAGPVVVPLAFGGGAADAVVTVEINVGKYERRIACGAAPRTGVLRDTVEGLGVLTFESPNAAKGGGRAVVFVPAGHGGGAALPVLVGLHPWDATMWSYAAYAPLLREAQARGVVLLFPAGLGNSLYAAPAEDEALRAIDALSAVGRDARVDPSRVSLWGASMGGAGATTIGLHHPSRFASITSFFGDSKYDLNTYVRGILKDERGAHLVNALDVVDNARHVPVYLVHGEADRVSPILQSTMLAQALGQRRFFVHFDRVAGSGHDGALVTRFLPELVARAATAKSPPFPSRVSYRAVAKDDAGAYGVHVERAGAGDTFVDLESDHGGIIVHDAENVREVTLDDGALDGACREHGTVRFVASVAAFPVKCISGEALQTALSGSAAP